MKQLVKTLVAMLLIAMCLTSDTASYATQVQSYKFQVPRSEQSSSMNSSVCVSSGQRLLYWENQRWTPLGVMRPCGSTLP